MKELKDTAAYFYLLFFFLIFVTIGYRFINYVVLKDYTIESHAFCDVENESCFIADCEEGDPECESVPYKIVTLPAYVAPQCLVEHTCEQFACEGECTPLYCSEETVSPGEHCSKKTETLPEEPAVTETQE